MRHTRLIVTCATLFLGSLVAVSKGQSPADGKRFEPRQYRDADGHVLAYRLLKPADVAYLLWRPKMKF